MVEQLGDEFKFYILTSDRDLGDKEPYPNIHKGVWSVQGKAQVLYLSPASQTLFGLYRVLHTFTYDSIYLNSCFSPVTICILLFRKLGLLPHVPYVLAPEGEFSPGALAIKGHKKHIYLTLSNLIGLYKGIRWRASSDYESEDIRKHITQPLRFTLASPISVYVAPDLATPGSISDTSIREVKTRGELRVLFLSRISRKKNLDFALNLLRNVKGNVYFDIYGPVEDRDYWQECQLIINALPSQVHVQYCGLVSHQEVAQIFGRYHLFLFPTRGENFGHVILESLSAGCPVLISDQTPWCDLEKNGCGWNLPLSDPNAFMSILDMCVEMDQPELNSWSLSARAFASRHLKTQEETTLQLYRNLLAEGGSLTSAEG
jgi:glycosyltransferase involved in cell wall biosynthesis